MLVEEAGAGSRRSRGEVGFFAFFGFADGQEGCGGWSREGCVLAVGGFSRLEGRLDAAGHPPGPARAAPLPITPKSWITGSGNRLIAWGLTCRGGGTPPDPPDKDNLPEISQQGQPGR